MIEKTQRKSFIRTLAERAAIHPQIERAVMGALSAVLPNVIEGILSDDYGGGFVKIRSRKLKPEHRVARDARILAAHRAKMPVSSIAQQESMSQFGVRKAIARLTATSVP